MHQSRSFSESCWVWHMLWTMGGCIYSVQMTPQISLFLSRKEIEISIPSELHSLSKRLSSDLTSCGSSRNRGLFLLRFLKDIYISDHGRCFMYLFFVLAWTLIYRNVQNFPYKKRFHHGTLMYSIIIISSLNDYHYTLPKERESSCLDLNRQM